MVTGSCFPAEPPGVCGHPVPQCPWHHCPGAVGRRAPAAGGARLLPPGDAEAGLLRDGALQAPPTPAPPASAVATPPVPPSDACAMDADDPANRRSLTTETARPDSEPLPPPAASIFDKRPRAGGATRRVRKQ